MHTFVSSAQLDNVNTSKKAARLEELKQLIRKDRELDLMLGEKFPVNHFGSSDELLRIKGSKDLLDNFNRIYTEKIDIPAKLEDIEYVGLSDKEQIILRFKNEDFSATGIYNFTYDFFEDLFNMGKFSKFCIQEGYNDLIKENLGMLLQGKKDAEKQYRLIERNGQRFLRGLTSTRYKNYDNNLALYLSLLGLHRFCAQNNVYYYVRKAFLSDSALNVVLEQGTPTNIPGVGKVYFGVMITNNEVRERKFSFEIRYRVVERNNNEISFAAVPDLSDSVFNFNHITGLDKAEQKIQNIFKLSEIQNSMLDYIAQMKNVKTLSDETLNSLMQTIIYSRNFKANTKKNFRELYDKKIIKNTMNLIQAFNKIDSITSDVYEQVCLEHIYHQIIVQLSGSNRLAV